MGAEAGQDLEAIVARKEQERQLNDGVFFWGIGNPLGQAPRYAALIQSKVPVIFSRMLSGAKVIDSEPTQVVRWTSYIDEVKSAHPLPTGAIVTSRLNTPSGLVKMRHYALVCFSDQPLTLRHAGTFYPSDYRNLGAGGRIASSQVTAMLRRVSNMKVGPAYEINLLACLAPPYFVQLADPAPSPRYDGDNFPLGSLLKSTA